MKEGKNSKSEFVVKFLEAVFDFSKDFVQLFARESWHYKDLHIGGYDPEEVYRNINNLKQRGILERKGKGRFLFTSGGFKWAQTSAQRYFKRYNKTWDKKWRVVIFDIPQELHNARNEFRRKLKNLGFFMLQKSVFIFPYSCEEELSDLCGYLKINDYVDVLIAQSAGFREEDLKKHYNL